MLANWVKQDTATTGTGTITLGSAVTGFLAIGDQFADGELVMYTIEDGNDRESGIGTYTASGTTLARTTVLETLVSGTLDNTAPTAITLTGSGVVSISAVSQTMPSIIQQGHSAQSGVIDFRWGLNNTRRNTTTSISADRTHWYPFYLEVPTLIDQMGIVISTGGGSAPPTNVVHIGFYTMNPTTGEPEDRVCSVTDLDPTITTFQSGTCTEVLLSPGWYFTFIWTDVAITMRAFDGAINTPSPVGLASSGLEQVRLFYKDTVTSLTEGPASAVGNFNLAASSGNFSLICIGHT